MRYLRIQIQFLIILIFSLATEPQAQAAHSFSVNMPTPAGYSKIAYQDFPDYFSTIAVNLEAAEYGLLELFIPTDEVELLRQADFDQVTRAIVVASSHNSGIDEEKLLASSWEQSVISPIELDMAAINEWLNQAREGRVIPGPLRTGLVGKRPGFMAAHMLLPPDALTAFGMVADAPLSQVLAIKQVKESYIHIFITSVWSSRRLCVKIKILLKLLPR